METALEPIDSVAQRVISRGSELKLNYRFRQEIWFAPPPTHKIPDDIEDLTGRKGGRITVFGYLGKTGFNGNPKRSRTLGSAKKKWLVKCDCGSYEIRNGKTAKNLDKDDACQYCRYLEKLKSKKEKMIYSRCV